MWSPDNLLIIGLIFLLAGLVKGVVGLGLPTVALALLTASFDLKVAIVLLLVPSFITNVWQAGVGGAFTDLLRRLWHLLIPLSLAVFGGVAVAIGIDSHLLTLLLGVLIALYATSSLMGFQVPELNGKESWLSPLVGLLNGFLTGLTGSFVFPVTLYLQALQLSRDALIQAMGIVFTVSTVALGLSLLLQGQLAPEIGKISALGVVPALLGMVIGQRLRRKLSEKVFRKVFFGALLLLGLYIAINGAR